MFRKPLARILLLFEAFASGFPMPDFEMISERVQTFVGLETCFLWIPKVTFGTFSGLCFASLWHESCCCLRLSQAVFQGQTEGYRDLFFMDSKGDARRFFWLVFRKPLARILLLFEAFASGFPRPDGGLETCFVFYGFFEARLSQAVFQGQISR